MKNSLKRWAATLLACLLLVPPLGAAAAKATIPLGTATLTDGEVEATILFTHDMHSHLLPADKEGGGEYGGFARLSTLLKTERTAAEAAGRPCITIDGGDFSMGSLFQTVYTTQAAELRSLGAVGVDVTTLGNHEYEYRAQGLADMLEAALISGDPLPRIVQANYKPPREGEEGYDASSAAVWKALEDYGVTDYTMIEKEGVRFAVFGVLGKDADDCSPMSGMVLEPIAQAAQRVVDTIREKEDYDFILCCSHSGTNPDPAKSEDEQLAKTVDGIDFIVSGHTHSTMAEPKIVGNTVIGCVGEYCTNLGSVTLRKGSDGTNEVVDYRLIPVDETVEEDGEITKFVAGLKTLVERDYLSRFDMEWDQVLCRSPFDFTPISQFAKEQEEDPLGSLITDAYLYAVRQAEGGMGAPITAAFVNAGVIRASFAKGDITVSDVFDVSSIGSGADGTAGYPLIDVWLTGREIRNVMELDPSVGPIFSGAQLYSSGVSYHFNMNRMLFNRMTDPALQGADGTKTALEDGALYRVVTNLYSSQMLGMVTDKSFGILEITPKDERGNPITDYESHIIHLPNGEELKEWYAVATYLSSFPAEEGVAQMPSKYAAPEGRKVREEGWDPVSLLKQPNWITLTVVGVGALLVFLVIFIPCRIILRRRRRSAGGRGRARGYRGYRG